jgi:hypothetical protein
LQSSARNLAIGFRDYLGWTARSLGFITDFQGW